MAQDKFPVAILQRSGSVDKVYEMSSGTGSFNGPTLITNDGLINQWTPRRNGWGYDAGGKAHWSHVNTSNDIQVFTNSSTGWQISGSWTSEDSSTDLSYVSLDVHSRKDWLWIIASSGATFTLYPFHFKCADNELIWGGYQTATPLDSIDYSFALTNLLQGAIHNVFVSGAAATYLGHQPEGTAGSPSIGSKILLTDSALFPAIVSDNNHRLWAFYTQALGLEYSTQDANFAFDGWYDRTHMYTIGQNFTGLYNTCHRPEDDTMHIALIEYDEEVFFPEPPDDPFTLLTYRLKYFRRTPNEWIEVLIDTWSGSNLDGFEDQQVFVTPQITSSPTGIMIYNQEVASGVTVSNIKYYFLDTDGYDDPVTSGSWASGTMMSGTSTLVGIVAPENWPV